MRRGATGNLKKWLNFGQIWPWPSTLRVKSDGRVHFVLPGNCLEIVVDVAHLYPSCRACTHSDRQSSCARRPRNRTLAGEARTPMIISAVLTADAVGRGRARCWWQPAMHASVRDRRRCRLSRPWLYELRRTHELYGCRRPRYASDWLTASTLHEAFCARENDSSSCRFVPASPVQLCHRSPGIGVAAATIYRTGPLVHSGAGISSC